MTARIRGPYWTADVPTAVAAGDELVFGDPDPARGQVEDLPSRSADLHTGPRIGPTPGTAARFVADDLVGIGHLL